MKKLISSLIISAMLVTMLAGVSSAATNVYKDVKSNHWAISAIMWGKKTGIVAGYPDGTFKPSKEVSEKDFITWAERSLKKSLKSKTSRPNQPVTRGIVAMHIAEAHGKNVDMRNAVAYLIERKIVKGSKTVDSFGMNRNLTRAEAMVILASAKSAGVPKPPAPKPVDPDDKNPNTNLDELGFENIKQFPIIAQPLESGNGKYGPLRVTIKNFFVHEIGKESANKLLSKYDLNLRPDMGEAKYLVTMDVAVENRGTKYVDVQNNPYPLDVIFTSKSASRFEGGFTSPKSFAGTPRFWNDPELLKNYSLSPGDKLDTTLVAFNMNTTLKEWDRLWVNGVSIFTNVGSRY